MIIDDYLDLDKLSRYVADGTVAFNLHPTLPLVLYTYGRKCVYDDLWDDVTTKCRGLIVQIDTGEIVARPYEKFFNLNTANRPETHLRNLPEGYGPGPIHRPLITEKLDGSLGIFWQYGSEHGIATKGSFTSEHALWATTWIKDHIQSGNGAISHPEYCTPVFEIICEEVQHHVVHYGRDRLVLLSMINKDTGEELPYNELLRWGRINNLEVAQAYNLHLFEVLQEDRPNHEGYVVSWNFEGRPPLKVKIKHETFLRHQKILHSATPKHIFELLEKNDIEVLAEWLDVVPTEIKAYIADITRTFKEEYSRIFRQAYVIMYEALQKFTTRKEYATYFLQPENKIYSAICFALLDNTTNTPQHYKKAIWKLVWQNIGKTMVANTHRFETEEEAA